MPNVVCSKCGATATSKCPECRTVFQTNQLEAIISLSLKTWTEERHGQEYLMAAVALNDQMLEKGEWVKRAETAAEAFERLVDLANTALRDVGPKQWTCDHSWVFAPGQKSSIGCGHGAE